MIRIKYHPPGTAPATLVSPSQDKQSAAPEITLIQYDNEAIFEEKFASFPELAARIKPDRVNWINIDGLSNIGLLRELGDYFQIHPLALEDVLNTAQRPKFEHYEGHYFIISEMIYEQGEKRIAFEQISMFLGQHFVITLQEEKGRDVFEAVRVRLRSGRGYARRMKADYLAYALLDAIVDQFFPILEKVGDGIEDIEEELLGKPTKDTLRRLHENKRLLLQLRRAAWPQREILNQLSRDDADLVSKETQIFLRDCYDHITQVIDILENFRDLSAGLMDVYLSSLSIRTNEIMRVLTVVTSVFAPLTFIAGIYGMNFNTASPWNMPELNWKFGYFACLALMGLVATAMVAFFKRKHWL